MEKNDVKTLLSFIRNSCVNAKISFSRGVADFLSDKIKQASSCDSVQMFAEQLIKLLDSDITKMGISIAQVSQITDSKAIRWIRTYAKIAASVACLKQAEYNSVIDSIQFDFDDVGDQAVTSDNYDIRISAVTDAPLSHGGDVKSGNATLFRRCQVLCKNGKTLELPFVAGNAIRGQIRDLLADDFLTMLGIEPSKNNPKLALWFFHSIYSGGALCEGESKATKALNSALGDFGSCRSEGTREFRNKIPILSALGCAAGNRILSGAAGAKFSNWIPQCYEWGNGTAPVSSLLGWEFLTRREDYEAHEDNTSMIANTEVLKKGTVLVGGVDFNSFAWRMDKCVIIRGLDLLKESGYIGANGRQGFGKISMDYEVVSKKMNGVSGEEYVQFVNDNKGMILSYLEEINAIHEGGQFDSKESSESRQRREISSDGDSVGEGMLCDG